MEKENYDKWNVKKLEEFLSQHDINTKDIKGTGKNKKVVKNDLIHAIKNLSNKNVINTQAMIHTELNDVLPNDILYQILLESSYQDINNMCDVNKRLHLLCLDKNLWKNIVIRDFNILP